MERRNITRISIVRAMVLTFEGIVEGGEKKGYGLLGCQRSSLGEEINTKGYQDWIWIKGNLLCMYTRVFKELSPLLGFYCFESITSDLRTGGRDLKKTNLTAMARPAWAAMIPMRRRRLVRASARPSTGYKFRTRNKTDHANPTDTETHCMTLIIADNENI
jgi:hypothetical protein